MKDFVLLIVKILYGNNNIQSYFELNIYKFFLKCLQDIWAIARNTILFVVFKLL